jgi:predicted O-methyltransferase YrrM
MHSPFVFDFITNVLNDQQHKTCYQPIENRRAALLNNSDSIEVEDFGAGSGVIRSNKRRIDKIAASSLKPKKYAQLMHRMVSYYKPATIVELGTSFGVTTSYLAKGSEKTKVFTFEGSSAIAAIANQTFEALSINNIILQQGNFDITLPEFLTSNPAIDLAFIDGNHRKQPTLQYFDQLQGACNENTILIFDDIHWSAEMESAWETIKNHPSVTLSMDLFFIGIVLFKKEFLVKQHFSIRH